MSEVNDNQDVTSEAVTPDKIPPESETIHIPANSSHPDLADSVASGDWIKSANLEGTRDKTNQTR